MRPVASSCAVDAVAVLGSEVGQAVATVLVDVSDVEHLPVVDGAAATLADHLVTEAAGVVDLLPNDAGVRPVLGVGVLRGHQSAPSSMTCSQIHQSRSIHA